MFFLRVPVLLNTFKGKVIERKKWWNSSNIPLCKSFFHGGIKMGQKLKIYQDTVDCKRPGIYR